MSLEISDSIKWVKGVGPKKAQLLSGLNIFTIRDFLYLSPRKYLDRSQIKLIKDIRVNEEVTVDGKVISVNSRKSRKGKLLCDVAIYDGSGIVVGRWFNQPWVKDKFNKDDHLIFSGKVEFFKGIYILNPEYEFLTEEDTELIHTGRIIPIYPLTRGLGQRFMRRTVNFIFQNSLGIKLGAIKNNTDVLILLTELVLRKISIPPTLQKYLIPDDNFLFGEMV